MHRTREEWERLVRCYTVGGTPARIGQVVDWLVANPEHPRACILHAAAVTVGAQCWCTPCARERRAVAS